MFLKTPDFWYTSPPPLGAQILKPLSWLWQGGTALRRWRASLSPKQSPPLPTLCVGNVVLGGGGKTPMVRALAHVLQQCGHRPVVVTRGYGGTQRMATRVDVRRHTADDVGDEAMMLAGAVSGVIAAPCVVVARDRRAGLRLAATYGDCAIVDDGLQNPFLNPTASLLVINGTDGFGNGLVCPAGPLREPMDATLARVAAVVIVGEDTAGMRNRLPKELPVLSITPEARLPETLPRGTRVLAFAGIARSERFRETCTALGLKVVDWQSFPDHHRYCTQEIVALQRRAHAQNLRLVTTEKDKARLIHVHKQTEEIAVVSWRITLAGMEALIVGLLFT